jgi:hypothetical protein
MHNSIPEYASTTGSHDHAIPCQAIRKEAFEEVNFSSNIIKHPPSPQDTKHIYKKERRKKKSSKGIFK